MKEEEMLREEPQIDKDLELLSEFVHELWAEWMRYMLRNGHFVVEKSGDIQWIVGHMPMMRWTRQMNTDYKNLPAEEQLSDKKIAQEILDLVLEN